MKLGLQTRRWHEGDPRLTNAVLCGLGLVLVLLAHQFTAEVTHFHIGFSGVSLLSVCVYAAAALVVLTQPVDRRALRIVVGFAVPMYAITFLADPFLSSDIYRYVWDGIVQHAGVNPYHFVPGNAALTFLRAPNQEIFDNINRRDYAPTIYPPIAQMLFWLATWVSPTVAGMKLLMLGFVAVTSWALVRMLDGMGRPRAEVLLFLWAPLLVWEVGDAGHVDAIVCGFVALALLFRLRSRPVLTGLFLGCAILTKFYPVLLLPVLWQRRDWKMPATVAVLCAAGYACYLSVGWKVFGFLGGYQKEEGIDSGSRFFLLDWVHSFHSLQNVPKAAFMAFSALVLGGIVLWAWRHATPERVAPWQRGPILPVPAFVRVAGWLAFAFMLLFSPHYAWYILWLVPFMALDPNLPLFVYVLGFFYGFTTGLALPGPKMFLLNKRLYACVLAAFLLEWALRRAGVWPRLLTRPRALDAGSWKAQTGEARSVGV